MDELGKSFRAMGLDPSTDKLKEMFSAADIDKVCIASAMKGVRVVVRG